MFLLVGLGPRHVLQTADQLQVGEPRQRGLARQIGGTVPAVSPEDTSAHPFTALRRRHCTFLTHFTVHDEARFVHRVSLSVGPMEHVASTNFTSCANLVHVTIFYCAVPLRSRNSDIPFVSRCQDIFLDLLMK